MPRSKAYFYRYGGDFYPTVRYMETLHDRVIAETGGASGVLSPGVLDSAAHKPVQSLGDQDAYPTFFTKVAALGYTLAHDHGFRDGNKRTALMSMLTTLKINGFHATPTDREKETVIVLVAMGLLNVPGLRIALMMWCGIDPAEQEA